MYTNREATLWGLTSNFPLRPRFREINSCFTVTPTSTTNELLMPSSMIRFLRLLGYGQCTAPSTNLYFSSYTAVLLNDNGLTTQRNIGWPARRSPGRHKKVSFTMGTRGHVPLQPAMASKTLPEQTNRHEYRELHWEGERVSESRTLTFFVASHDQTAGG